MARRTISFYATVKTYAPLWEMHGFGDAASAAGEAFRRGDLAGVPAAIPDAMVETYCAAGPLDKVRARVEATAERADGLFLTPPTYFISPEELSEFQNRIIDAFGPRAAESTAPQLSSRIGARGRDGPPEAGAPEGKGRLGHGPGRLWPWPRRPRVRGPGNCRGRVTGAWRDRHRREPRHRDAGNSTVPPVFFLTSHYSAPCCGEKPALYDAWSPQQRRRGGKDARDATRTAAAAADHAFRLRTPRSPAAMVASDAARAAQRNRLSGAAHLALDVGLADPVGGAVGLPGLDGDRDRAEEHHPGRPEVAAFAERPDHDGDDRGEDAGGGDALEVLLQLQPLDRELAADVGSVDSVPRVRAECPWSDGSAGPALSPRATRRRSGRTRPCR